MVDVSSLTKLITLLRLETEKDSISPERVGYILQRMLDLISDEYTSEEIDEAIAKLKGSLSDDYRARIANLKEYTDEQIADTRSYVEEMQRIFNLIYESDPENWQFIADALAELESNMRMEINCDGGDIFITYGETKHIVCKVYNGYGKDVTDSVTRWKITRDSGFPADDNDRNDDEDWNTYKSKVKSFNGTIDLLFVDGNDEDGLPLDDFGYLAHQNLLNVTFTITAYIDNQEVQAQLLL